MIVYHYIGGKKTSLKDIRGGIPKHEAGNMNAAYESLKKKGFFIYEMRKREPYFSLHPKNVGYANELIRYNRCPFCNYYLKNLQYCTKCEKDLSNI